MLLYLLNFVIGKKSFYNFKYVFFIWRFVIFVVPELTLTQARIPTSMIINWFKPYIIQELIRKTDEIGNKVKPITSNVKIAEQIIMKEDDKSESS